MITSAQRTKSNDQRCQLKPTVKSVIYVVKVVLQYHTLDKMYTVLVTLVTVFNNLVAF